MFSSKDQTWETSQELFDDLNRVFEFELDVCADNKSAKCEYYYSEEENGLIQDWKGICWMNPPYSRHQHKWVKKGIEEVDNGNCKQLVVLIPARVETVAWQDYIFKRAVAICFVRGRLKFNNCEAGAPFPSAICVFGEKITEEQKNVLEKYGKLFRKR